MSNQKRTKKRGHVKRMNISNCRKSYQGELECKEISVAGEILFDLRPDGTVRPWMEKKLKTLLLSDSLRRLGDLRRADRVQDCGTYLEFSTDFIRKVLRRANFCKCRLCPMCAWRRSLRAAYVLSSVMDEVENEHPRLVPLFLTLTVKNCDATTVDLSQTLDVIFKGWNRFLQVKRTKMAVQGWFRSLEVTYNRETDTFHPHIHAVVYVDQKYLKGVNYIKTVEWVELWRSACKFDYDPVCDIRRIKNNGKRGHIKELAKYTVKDTDFLTADESLTDKLVLALNRSLRCRRLNAFGGIMKEIAKALRLSEENETDDLIHIGDGTIREDVNVVIVRYLWRFGVSQYVGM